MTYIDNIYIKQLKTVISRYAASYLYHTIKRLTKDGNPMLVTVEWLFYVRFSYSYHTLKLATCKYHY